MRCCLSRCARRRRRPCQRFIYKVGSPAGQRSWCRGQRVSGGSWETWVQAPSRAAFFFLAGFCVWYLAGAKSATSGLDELSTRKRGYDRRRLLALPPPPRSPANVPPCVDGGKTAGLDINHLSFVRNHDAAPAERALDHGWFVGTPGPCLQQPNHLSANETVRGARAVNRLRSLFTTLWSTTSTSAQTHSHHLTAAISAGFVTQTHSFLSSSLTCSITGNVVCYTGHLCSVDM